MEGKKRKAIDDTGGDNGGDNGDGGGASGYGGNTRDIGQLPRRPRTGSILPHFLRKTFDMVEDPETNSIISWSPNNRSFTIWDHIKFSVELLPKNFKHSNLASFVSQLNNYGFRKICTEKYEYENPWFQAGKRHWLKHIKRRNRQCEHDSVIQSSCGSTDNLLKGRLEDQLETLMIEHHGLKVKVEKLSEKLGNHFNKIKEIQKLIEKRKMSKYEANKNQELDNSTSEEISLELVAEGNCSRHTNKDEQVQEEVMVIQKEGKNFCSPDNTGGSNQEKKATATSETFENRDFRKKMIEDDSEHENGGHEELEESHPEAILKLLDLNACNTLVQDLNAQVQTKKRKVLQLQKLLKILTSGRK
nr:heat stress transcription factor A-7a-like [Coffea arabica]